MTFNLLKVQPISLLSCLSFLFFFLPFSLASSLFLCYELLFFLSSLPLARILTLKQQTMWLDISQASVMCKERCVSTVLAGQCGSVYLCVSIWSCQIHYSMLALHLNSA